MRAERKAVRGLAGALPRASAAALSAALTILATGCASPPGSAYVAGSASPATGATVAIGNDAVGEPCRYQPLPASGEFGVAARHAVALYCGNWQQPSGRVFELDGVADPSAALHAASWRAYLDARFSCGAPVATRTLGGGPAFAMQCTRRYGGWPHVAMTSEIGGRVFAADTVPAALPALEATMASLAGQPVAVAGRPTSEVARLIARGAARAPFGSGDLQRFYDLMAAGDAYNNIDDPAASERSFRDALAVQQRFLGQNDPGLALTMM